jgi:hypothetical protein
VRRIPSSAAGARAWNLLVGLATLGRDRAVSVARCTERAEPAIPRVRHALLALLAAGLAGACVTPPTPAQILAVGFRTPEQAFHTFQTATRLDDPDLELRCFSVGFRARNQLSQLTWREGRAELYAKKPWLRAGIAGARIVDVRIDAGCARLRIDTAGGDYTLDLVREDFVEGWAGTERVLDDEVDWSVAIAEQRGFSERPWILGRVQLPADVAAKSITDLRFGREWKIDSVGPLEDTEESSKSRAEIQPSNEID